MKPAQVLYDLRELQDIWRKNNFHLNEGQQVTYDKLLQLRRQRVQHFYKTGQVFVVSKAAFDKAAQVEQPEEN